MSEARPGGAYSCDGWDRLFEGRVFGVRKLSLWMPTTVLSGLIQGFCDLVFGLSYLWRGVLLIYT